MAKHVDYLSEDEQKKWLKQRGWQPEGPAWRDPETGMTFMFVAALERAKKACRLPYDFELHRTGGAVFIDSDQYMNHAGQNYRVDTVFMVGAGGTINTVIIAPPIPTQVHFYFHIEVQNETNVSIFEDAVLSNAGIQAYPYNANRVIGGASQSRVFAAPTVTSNGTLLGQWHAGSGKTTGGYWEAQEEVILKQAGTYLAAAVNVSNATGWITYHLSFYEA